MIWLWHILSILLDVLRFAMLQFALQSFSEIIKTAINVNIYDIVLWQ